MIAVGDIYTMATRPCFIFCGARGADSEWLAKANALGHVVNQSLPRDRDLHDYFEQTCAIGRALRRPFPTNKPFTNQLLMRNIKAAMMTNLIYAVGFFDGEGHIRGGTAWACQTMIERRNVSDRLYFFDQVSRRWYIYDHEARSFRFMTGDAVPPAPSGGEIWLGIGSCNLSQSGVDAIRALWIS